MRAGERVRYVEYGNNETSWVPHLMKSPAPCDAGLWSAGGRSFLFPRHVDVALLSPLGGSDDPLPLHLLDDPGRAVEPDLEAALEKGDGGAAGADDFLDGGVEHLVAGRVGVLGGRGGRDRGVVDRRSLGLQMLHDALDLALPDVGAVDPDDPSDAGLEEEHVSEPEA